MVSRKMTITSAYGIHARTAAELAAGCRTCTSEIRILVDEKSFNPKNVMELMCARIPCGKEITVVCDGDGENEDLEKIAEIIVSL